MFVEENKDGQDKFRNMFGPGQVDAMVRQAIQTCWMAMPEGKRTVAHVEAEVRRLLDRAIKNMKEDADTFGIGDTG